MELRSKGYVNVVGAGPFQVQAPRSWGSLASRLTTILLNGHSLPEVDRQVRLDRESRDRILTWIDINAPYYPDYAGGAYRDNPYGRSPLTHQEVSRFGKLVCLNLLESRHFVSISFTRPELSPCLSRLSGPQDPRYREALALLQLGRQRLAEHSRPDMPGFRLTSRIEINQEAKYQKLHKEETAMRAAISQGKKLFPPAAVRR